MDLDLNGNLMKNTGEDFFFFKAFYDFVKYPSATPLLRDADGKVIYSVPCNCYLIEVFSLLTSVATPPNDYKFRLTIFTPRFQMVDLRTSSNSSKIQRFNNFTPVYFRKKDDLVQMRVNYGVPTSIDDHVKFPKATFLFKFFKESNF